MNILEANDGMRLVRDIAIPMRDGVHLAADLHVPATGDHPAGLL